MTWRSPANETGLLGHKVQLLLRSDPLWFANGKHALVDLCTSTVMGRLVRRGRRVLLAASFRLSKRHGAVFRCHQLGCNPLPRQGILLQILLRARTVSTFCSSGKQKLYVSSSLMTLRSEAANSLGRSKLASSARRARAHCCCAGLKVSIVDGVGLGFRDKIIDQGVYIS